MGDVHVSLTGPEGEPLGGWTTTVDGKHVPDKPRRPVPNLRDIKDHPQFVPGWDVYRDANGDAVTIECSYGHYDGPPLSDEQLQAVRHAVIVWKAVCAYTGSTRARDAHRVGWTHVHMVKSRLLHRMIHEGLPPTRTPPPLEGGGPAWWKLSGGDPFEVRLPDLTDGPISAEEMLDAADHLQHDDELARMLDSDRQRGRAAVPAHVERTIRRSLLRQVGEAADNDDYEDALDALVWLRDKTYRAT